VNKTNKCTECQFYWYYDSTRFGQPFCPSSGVLSRKSALARFMQLWRPFGTRSRMELPFHPAPGSKRSSQLHKTYQSRFTAKNSWWWAERLPETCRVVIPIKLAFSASVGLIHKVSVTMHGRGGVKSTRCLGPNMTARGQSIGIWIAMLPQTFWGDMEAITVQKTSKYYTT